MSLEEVGGRLWVFLWQNDRKGEMGVGRVEGGVGTGK